VIERAVEPQEVGRAAAELASDAPVIAVIRDDSVLRFDDERLGELRAGDALVCLCRAG
jgi:hypothetical protein